MPCYFCTVSIVGTIDTTVLNGDSFLDRLRVTNPPIRLMCPTSNCPFTFSFPDSDAKTLCQIKFKLDREIGPYHRFLSKLV